MDSFCSFSLLEIAIVRLFTKEKLNCCRLTSNAFKFEFKFNLRETRGFGVLGTPGQKLSNFFVAILVQTIFPKGVLKLTDL